MQYRQTAAIMLAPGVTYLYSDHIQWTSENSTDTTLGHHSVDITAVSSFHSYQRQCLLDVLHVQL